MTQKELAERIIGSFTDKEWELLAQNQMDIPVSAWNRQTLLELHRSNQAFQKEISPEDVKLLSDSIYDYLAEVWDVEPAAYQYVVGACLTLTFLFERPMHPAGMAGWKRVMSRGKSEYQCPAKTDSIICNYCVAKETEEPSVSGRGK